MLLFCSAPLWSTVLQYFMYYRSPLVIKYGCSWDLHSNITCLLQTIHHINNGHQRATFTHVTTLKK